jgi:hypothetical protein
MLRGFIKLESAFQANQIATNNSNKKYHSYTHSLNPKVSECSHQKFSRTHYEQLLKCEELCHNYHEIF